MAATNPHLRPLPNYPSLAALEEREQVYGALDVWDDEDTQVTTPLPMSDLVNGTEPRNTNHLRVRDRSRSAEAPCKGPGSGRNAQ